MIGVDKNGEQIREKLFIILQFLDVARFMASSLSNIDNNLSEGIHKIKCKRRNGDRKCEIFRIK